MPTSQEWVSHGPLQRACGARKSIMLYFQPVDVFAKSDAAVVGVDAGAVERFNPRCAVVHDVGAPSGCVEAARGWSLHGSAPVMANA